ncbi:hypothetical protein H6G04_23325 [Calothrix membranacea FACHB-236]|nr:hypothetical protein [Calothrix membranacea FACHB-236]
MSSEIKFKTLQTLYSNYILISEKAIKFFTVSKQDIEILISCFENYKIEPTIYQKYYPFPVDNEDLKGIDVLTNLTHIEITDENISLVFCTRHSFTERTEINLNDFNPEAQNKLIYYDKVYGTKRQIYQSFDVIVIWKNKGLIEARIDISKNHQLKEYHHYFNKIINTFNILVEEKLGIEKLLKECVNLFPLINTLYNSNNEGKIVELSFITDEGSTKRETIRKDKDDLRHETYHSAGKKAVHHITPYQLKILWDFTIFKDKDKYINSQIILNLPGKFYTLSSNNPKLEEIIIEKCGFMEEYDFIFNIINKYFNYEN